VEEVRGGPAGPFADLTGDPHPGGHADHEVLRADRRARAHLAPPPGPRPGRPAAAGPVAAAGAGACPRRGPPARAGASGLGAPHGVGDVPPRRAPGLPGHRAAAAARRGAAAEANYQRERRALAARRKAAFATEPTGPNQVWQLDFSPVRDHRRRHVAAGRLPGLLEQVRAGLAHLPDGQPARRDRRGRARAHRGRPPGRPSAARPGRARRAGPGDSAGHHRDRQRRAVPLLSVRGWGYLPLAGDHRHPPRAAPRPHPGEDARVRTAHASAASAR
jgi:hypothetical protein